MVSTTPFKAVRVMRLPLLVATVVGVVVVAGCGSSKSTTSAATPASSNAAPASSTASSAPAQGATENVAMKIAGGKMAKQLGYIGPDGKGHDTYIPSTIKVKAGDTISVTVANYDEGPHSFTSPSLGVNASIPGAINATKKIPSKTTFTFTAKQAGKFRWYCMIPCDLKQNGWAMTANKNGEPSQDGFMAGYVVAS
jgi:plastocyanin